MSAQDGKDTESVYVSTDLREYLSLETWAFDEALLLLAGLHPLSTVDWDQREPLLRKGQPLDDPREIGEYDMAETEAEIAELQVRATTFKPEADRLKLLAEAAALKSVMDRSLRAGAPTTEADQVLAHIDAKREGLKEARVLNPVIALYEAAINDLARKSSRRDFIAENVLPYLKPYEDRLRKLHLRWRSRRHRKGETDGRMPVANWITWAESIDLAPGWLEWARGEGLLEAAQEGPVNDRNTLLAIIYGMARAKYKYDPERPKNAATGDTKESIWSDLDEYDLPGSVRKVREVMTEAKRIFHTQKN